MNTDDLRQSYEELMDLLHRKRRPCFMEKVFFLWDILWKGNLFLFFKTELAARNLLSEREAMSDSNLPVQSVSSELRSSAISRSEERVAVYTTMFGRVEKMYEPALRPGNIDYYLVTDRRTFRRLTGAPDGSEAGNSFYGGHAEYKGWSVFFADDLGPDEPYDPVRKSRFFKMHPHFLFPDYRYSVYFDANHILLGDMSELTVDLDTKPYPAAMFIHRTRDCVYQEIARCIALGKGDRNALRGQEKRIRQSGMPEHNGLLYGAVIARFHHHPGCIQLMDAWWECYMRGTERDQIALAEALWREKIPVEEIGTLGTDFEKCRLFVRMEHRTVHGK